MEDCKHLEAHEERFCNIESEMKHRVSWVVFVWAIGVLTAAQMASISYMTTANKDVTQSRIEIAEMKVKLASIETLLVEIKIDLKAHSK